ncbi:MAG TPA: ATP synthase F1 subunit epsilon [Gemmataceae bacterium]|nr:ATP synthase F1 subunit epsilon [Gemmataceae bacterium]
MDQSTRSLQCVVVTPERAVLDEAVDFVALPMYDGELGVLPGRAPLIGRLGSGELRIRHGATTRRFFVDGGFAQVRSNTVTVLTPRAIRGEDVDTQAATQSLDLAHTPAVTPEAQETHQRTLERARAQLRVARRAHGETEH